MTEGVQWGWRVRCEHAGCPAEHVHWGDHGDGPPSLVRGPGWAYHYERRPNGVRYRTYCPEHAPVLEGWRVARKGWERERHRVGGSWWECLVGVLTGRPAHQVVGRAVRRWEQEHPAPTPPWLRET